MAGATPPPPPPATNAIDKHPCAACGAQAEWNPTRQRLSCPFCGTESPYEIDSDSGEICEIDLVTTLRELPEELRGWAAEKRSVRCGSCRAVSVFDAERVGQRCDFCGSPALVDYDEILAPLRPLSLLPFKISESQVRERLRRWYRTKWLAPKRLRVKAALDRIRGAYLPYWTFDARAHCRWTAESGTYYYTTESYRDSQGRQRRRQVRHTRWRNASGQVEHFFDDHPVPATVGVDRDLLGGVEPFPTANLVPYDTAYLSGFVVEHYQVVLIDAVRESRAAMHNDLRRLCADQVPGDTHRRLVIEATYADETFKLILVPVWLLSYDYGARSFKLLVNGYTGRIAGRYPKSPWKILALVLAALATLALIVFLMSR